MRVSFKTPGIIGELKPDFFDGIREVAPDASTGMTWSPVNKPGGNTDLFDALQPLTDLIYKLPSSQVQPPHMIIYQVETEAVPPGESQRGISWHVDGGNVRAAVVADAIPTEFLVRSRPRNVITGMWARHQLAKKADKLYYRPDDLEEFGGLDSLGLEIYQPEPNEVILMDKQIHRSPVNATEADIARTWIRAAILNHTPDRNDLS